MKLNLLLSLSLILPFIALCQVNTINEEKFITIGGIEQWITIKGNDRSKPVILFLHGGPGSVMTPYSEAVTGKWKDDFILVNWDQRGAGRTFGKNAPVTVDEDYWISNPLTIHQMTRDAIELSEYLVKHLNKKTIIILGTSWGSILGVNLALARPDLFTAYLGHAQVVNPSQSLVEAYSKVSQLAVGINDITSIQKLKSIGPPPYDDARNAGQLFSIIKKYEKENSIPSPEAWWKINPAYDNEKDSKNREDGDDYSFINYIGHKKLGITPMMSSLNFMDSSVNFKIPVFIIQGEADILTPKESTRIYFGKITATQKEYFLVRGAAHGFNQPVVDTLYSILKKTH